jgi:glycosyltransferase involved in cell wall biosynthesis
MTRTVLVVDRSPSLSSSQGNELIARHLFPRLRRDHRLILVAPVADDADDARAALADRFDEVHLVERPGRIAAIGGWVEGEIASRGVGRVVAGSRPAAALATVIRDRIARRDIDAVHVRQLPMAGYGRVAGRTGRLLELIDSEALATSREPGSGLKRRVRRLTAPVVERLAMRGFDIVTAVADADADALRALGPRARVETVPNGVDLDVFAPAADAGIDPDGVVFVGAMSFPPNVAAAEWFARSVVPTLRALRPAATFTIVGRDPVPSVLALDRLDGVTVTGSVDDVRPYLARAAVVVAPLVSGSGIKNKVLEAFAMGRPVVATPLAVEGVAAEPGREVVVADGPDAMAEAVAGLLADPARAAAIGSAGRRLVEGRYSWDAAAERYATLYDELAGRTRR